MYLDSPSTIKLYIGAFKKTNKLIKYNTNYFFYLTYDRNKLLIMPMVAISFVAICLGLSLPGSSTPTLGLDATNSINTMIASPVIILMDHMGAPSCIKGKHSDRKN